MQQNNFTLSILTWYNKQKRILPFRDIDDPLQNLVIGSNAPTNSDRNGNSLFSEMGQ